MPNPMRIAVAQSTAIERDPLGSMLALIERHRDADLVVFPEMALHGHDPDDHHAVRRATPPERVAAFEAAVAHADVRAVYGRLVEREGRLYNVATLTDGKRSFDYAKTHVHWSEPFARGDSLPVCRDFGVPIGLLICFDAAFPEVARALALQGALIIVNVSAIPAHFSLDVVHRRVVACSVENQVITVFANRVGTDYAGGSMVLGPRGETLAHSQRDDLVVDVDLEDVERWRKEEPLFEHRREALYRAAATHPI